MDSISKRQTKRFISKIIRFTGIVNSDYDVQIFAAMAETIGQLIKRIAMERGLSQREFGEKIKRTKQGVANIYKRSTIDTALLKIISEELDYDFFAHFYEEPPLLKFRQKETAIWQTKVDTLLERLTAKEELLDVQRKYIAELEGKLKQE